METRKRQNVVVFIKHPLSVKFMEKEKQQTPSWYSKSTTLEEYHAQESVGGTQTNGFLFTFFSRTN
jgi:hypothetical protein